MRTGRPPLPVAPRFWAHTHKGDSCWTWTAARDRDGYGVMRVYGKMTKTHRVSWMLHYGSIPDGLQVLHRCDHPGCVRPDHLFLGTGADNVADMIEKRRHPLIKLTAADVGAIRGRPDVDRRGLAAEFGVHRDTIRRIRRGITRGAVGGSQ